MTPSRPSILYQGLLRSPASWARVGRGYLVGLQDLGIQTPAVRVRGFRYDADFPLPIGVEEISVEEARSRPAPDIGLGFVHPPHLDRLLGKVRANFFVWESDRVPERWVRELDAGTHVVLVPSEFSRRSLEASGLAGNQIAVVPYGHAVTADSIDEDRPPTGSPFRFLAVMSPHRRKGVVELLKGYSSAFSARDDVLLTIKTTYDPGKSRRRFPFEIPSWECALADAGLLANNAPRWQLDLSTLTDAETLSLYRQAHVYVNPSWGESFGLAILEAMACGTPAIATAWSGNLDFCVPGDDLIPYDLIDGRDALYEPVSGAQLAVPDVDALGVRMRWHFDHREASAALGVRCRETAAPRTWTDASRALLEGLQSAMDEATH
jgi:glycosyltransferase involved in cell wall biosynthesis